MIHYIIFSKAYYRRLIYHTYTLQKTVCAFWNVQNARDDDFDLEEILSTLSRQQIEDFWCSLSRKCASALLHLDEVDDDVTILSQCWIRSSFNDIGEDTGVKEKHYDI